MKLEPAYRYIITNGQFFVTDKDAVSLSANRASAYEWRSHEAALNVLNVAQNSRKDTVKHLSDNYRVESVAYYNGVVSADVKEDLETIGKFLKILKEADEFKSDVKQKLELYNNELQDIQHYIEGTDLGIVDGYKAYKKLQFIRQQRRIYKNKLKVMSALTSLEIDNNSLIKLLAEFEEVVYKPRVLDFDYILDEIEEDEGE